MKKKNINLILIITLVLTSFFNLVSCTNIVTTTEVKDEVNEEVNTLVTIPEVLGPGIHVMRNPENYTQIVFDENGNVLGRTISSDLEGITLIEDVKKGYAEYFYKADFTAEVSTSSYISTDDINDIYEDLMPIQKSKLYDKNGNEIKLPIDFENAIFAVGDNIFLRDANKNYYDKNLTRVWKNNDGTWDVDSDLYGNTIRYKEFNGNNGKYINLYFSTEVYDGHEDEAKAVITDEDLIVEKEIKGYNVDDIIDLKGKKIVVLIRLEGDKLKFNFLDENNNIVFDKDVDKNIPYDSESRIVTFKRDNKEFDFDFDTYTVVGEERDYVEKEVGDPIYLIKEKYNDLEDKIVRSNNKYNSVTTWYDRVNEKIRILAYYNEVFDEITGYKEDADVYDEEGKLLGTIPKFSACYEEDGLFFYNNKIVCDFDLNIVKTFEDEMYLSRNDKFGKTFYIERFDITKQNDDMKISDIKPFKVYDKDFNVLYDDLINVYEYSMDDYLIVVDKNSTRFVGVDENGNLYVKKQIDRPLDVSNWYSESDNKAFKDMKSGFYGIFDKDLNIIIDNMKNVIDLKKDYFTYERGFKYGLMDYEGREIVSFSIFDNIKE